MHRRFEPCSWVPALVALAASAACFQEADLPGPDDVNRESDSSGDTEIGTASSDPSSATTGSSSGETESSGTDTGTSVGECNLDAECLDDNPCSLDICDEHRCKNLPLDGVPVHEQTTGDCRTAMCVTGSVHEVAEPGDLPDDLDDCTADACNGADAEHMPEPLGTQCEGGGVCDGMAACLDCLSPDDCDGLPVDDDCAMRTCEAGVCGQVFAPAGTLVNATLQTVGDCQRVVCDDSGGTVVEPNDADPYVDGLECTEDLCESGDPQNPALPSGTPCAAGECDAYGHCTGCNEPEDCGAATSCQAPTCSGAGVCGVADTAEGTSLPGAQQNDGDCEVVQCDGSGASASYEDDDDVPPDDGNDCTDETCSGGLPQHPDAQLGTPCTDDGGSYCDGAGACVACIDAGDCPIAPACHVATCEANQCGIAPADAGTPCTDDLFCTATDVCNAAGSCVGSVNPCVGPDGDGDCSESCDEAANACTGSDPSGTPCIDGLFCTQSEACNDAGACIGTGDPCSGADGDGDCSESCDETADACTGDDPNGSGCDDGQACTTADACTDGSCTGTAVTCEEPQTCFETCLGCADAEC